MHRGLYFIPRYHCPVTVYRSDLYIRRVAGDQCCKRIHTIAGSVLRTTNAADEHIVFSVFFQSTRAKAVCGSQVSCGPLGLRGRLFVFFEEYLVTDGIKYRLSVNISTKSCDIVYRQAFGLIYATNTDTAVLHACVAAHAV